MNEIENFKLLVKDFKQMKSPFNWGPSKNILRYVMFADISSLDASLKNWFKTNPRHQNINQNVSKGIKKSLSNNPNNFHNLNKGILFSAAEVDYDNLRGLVNFSFVDPNIHGNIDGGHTLKVINEYKKEKENEKVEETYVFVEIIVGIKKIEEIVALAGARNKTVQVDLQSLANLEKKFDPIKTVLYEQNISFKNRIIYKTNENRMDQEEFINNNSEKKDIKIRDFIAILNMFNLDLYTNDSNSFNHPIVSYQAKEQALKAFLSLDDEKKSRFSWNSKSIEESVLRMEKVIKDIFELYDRIELEFPEAYNSNGRRYNKKTYATVRSGRTSKFGKKDLSKIPKVPDGLIYPLIGAFRALIYYNKVTNKLEWLYNPLDIWENAKGLLTDAIANFIDDNKEIDKPDSLGKSKTLWQTLFDKIQIIINNIEKASGNGSINTAVRL